MKMNSTHNATNLYNSMPPIVPLTPPSPESLLPFSNDALLQQVAKSINYHHYSLTNTPLKDDSGLTFNNSLLPFPRKRPRDATLSSSPSNFSFLGHDFSFQMTQHQFDLDRLISLHMEKIRREMEERRREQSSRIIQAIQGAIGRKLRDKEDEIDKIGKLNMALEERVRSLYLENQIWRDLAQTNEATANALRSNLDQVISQANALDFQICSGDAAAEDAESCCGSSGQGCEDEEVDGAAEVLKWRKVDGGERKEATAVMEEERRKRMCRNCGAKESSVLLLPCRHLCLCTACGSAVDTCPLCNSTTDATVHVNLS